MTKESTTTTENKQTLTVKVALYQQNKKANVNILQDESSRLPLSRYAQILLYQKGYLGNIYNPERHHPLLIEVIQELGGKAACSDHSTLSLGEIVLKEVNINPEKPHYFILSTDKSEAVYPDEESLQEGIDNSSTHQGLLQKTKHSIDHTFIENFQSPPEKLLEKPTTKKPPLKIVTFNFPSTQALNLENNSNVENNFRQEIINELVQRNVMQRKVLQLNPHISSFKQRLFSEKKQNKQKKPEDHPLLKAINRFETLLQQRKDLDMSDFRYYPPFINALETLYNNNSEHITPRFTIHRVPYEPNNKCIFFLTSPAEEAYNSPYPEYITLTEAASLKQSRNINLWMNSPPHLRRYSENLEHVCSLPMLIDQTVLACTTTTDSEPESTTATADSESESTTATADPEPKESNTATENPAHQTTRAM